MSSLERVQVLRERRGRGRRDAVVGFTEGDRRDTATSGSVELKLRHLLPVHTTLHMLRRPNGRYRP